jgi:hypothetical protein
MGLMDKAKEAALRAKDSAQQMAQQGQAKVQAAQQNRSEGELYRALGEAVYRAQRGGGDQAAVDAAFAALDQHIAAAPPVAPAAPGADTVGDAPPVPPASAPQPPQPAPTGDFTLDDL